jgi:hypothetical protein
MVSDATCWGNSYHEHNFLETKQSIGLLSGRKIDCFSIEANRFRQKLIWFHTTFIRDYKSVFSRKRPLHRLGISTTPSGPHGSAYVCTHHHGYQIASLGSKYMLVPLITLIDGESDLPPCM